MSEYRVEEWPPRPKGGMQVPAMSAGVKVTDLRTGKSHCCNIYRHQHLNRDAAIENLKAGQETGDE